MNTKNRRPHKVKKLVWGKRVPIPASLCDYNNNLITIQIERRNKYGKLIYPYIYQIRYSEHTWEYPVITRPGGWPGYAIPLGAFNKIGKRKELDLFREV